MIINRHNYEEHFILYWDNELTASQKQAVENFVNENKDLQEEFKLLGETRFTPDHHVQLEEKGFLLNNSFINITNYEEQLLNYIDDEVTAEERKEVEQFASQYSAVKQELALLQKTKLQPEAAVIFPDKSILYRREENADSYRHRVISMTWFRVAVAAAIILIAGFVTLRLINTDEGGDKNEVVRNGEIKTQPANPSTSPQVIIPEQQTPKETQTNIAKTVNKPAIKEPADNKKSKKPGIENNIVNSLATNTPENKNNLPKERNRTDQPVIDKNNSIDKTIASVDEPALPSKQNYKAEKSPSDKANNLLDNSSVTKSTTPAFANISAEDELFEKEKDKGGLKEFLRKTTRVFERRTKIQTTTEDNKLLLGAFAVSLK